MDYSALIGCRVEGSEMEGQIVDFSENSLALEINGQRYDFVISEDCQETSMQFNRLRGSWWDWDIVYDQVNSNQFTWGTMEVNLREAKFDMMNKAIRLAISVGTSLYLQILE
mgnify:CR=1 FL=1